MGADYARVHLSWTIPPALLLWKGLRRLRTRREVYKTTALILVGGTVCDIRVCVSGEADSRVTRPDRNNHGFDPQPSQIWSYPPSSCLGPTLASIPIEEVFFFFIQTYITSCIYAICSRPVLHVLLLPRSKKAADRATRIATVGTMAFLGLTAIAVDQLRRGGEWTYMALIVGWVCPFLALLWGVASSHIIALPLCSTLIPILFPTFYLWVCDAFALQRGTWVIERGTKLGVAVYGLEIEEAIFFLLTNVMVVFGLAACDHCLAIYDATPNYEFSSTTKHRPIFGLLRTVVTRPQSLPYARLSDLNAAVALLREKSKSFYTANFVFEGRLQLNLLSLYAWCRVADDLVDDASSSEVAAQSISLISAYLDTKYPSSMQHIHGYKCKSACSSPDCSEAKLLLGMLDPAQRATFRLLLDLPITRGPLDELLHGFKTDSSFSKDNSAPLIAHEDALLGYASDVASSVADLCMQLVWEEFGHSGTTTDRQHILLAARKMGQALQLVNIARDVPADAKIGRVYLPRLPLATLERKGGMEDATEARLGLLTLGKEMAEETRKTIDLIPVEARGVIRAACAVYMRIGQAVEESLRRGDVHGRAGVSVYDRVNTAWKSLDAWN
ncbi:BQ2448_1528 [Microbotryum intermedium]|uniref:Bifunctional lycopene cyclase/phytoene synthase n=1 Tax=Microbotryum intermedium TaxID=269621 RepID=A0A238FE20_9BASI|nr:BQ2448_1528 [Microbotryum intermedium]